MDKALGSRVMSGRYADSKGRHLHPGHHVREVTSPATLSHSKPYYELVYRFRGICTLQIGRKEQANPQLGISP